MSKFNIIIAKRGRDDYLKTCLYYLNDAIRPSQDVCIYVIADDGSVNFPVQWRLSTHYLDPQKEFCKSRLLNYGLSVMREDFDFVSIVDLDILYSPKFFDEISKIDNNTYFVSSGYKLIPHANSNIMEKLPEFDESHNFIDPALEHENIQNLYPSQISLSKSLYNKMVLILDNDGKLYDEGFLGWGGEDSVLSFFSRYCSDFGILKKVYSHDMWYHLWHPRECDKVDFDKVQYDKNLSHLQQQRGILEQKVRLYKNEKGELV